MFPSRWLKGAGLTLAALALGAGLGAHRWALAHVSYYTGDEPRTTNCGLCHVAGDGGTLLDRIIAPRYLSPFHLAMCPDGSRLYAVAQDGDALIEIDPRGQRLLRSIPVGRRPHGVVLDARCATAYVTNQDGGTVSVVDLGRGAVSATLPAGDGPAGLAIGRDGGTLFVADSRGGDIDVIELARAGGSAPPAAGPADGAPAGPAGPAAHETRLMGGSYPYGAAIAPDGSRVLVGSQLAQPRRGADPIVSEVTVVDARRRRVEQRLALDDAHLLEGIAFVPEGDLALVALVRPRNLIPVLQVERGWMMTNGLGVIDLAGGRIVQLPLDDLDQYYADPSDVAVAPDGRLAFVSHGGVDSVSVVDLEAVRRLLETSGPDELSQAANRLSLSARYVVKRIPVGSNPRGLAVSPDGRLLYVAERLDDRIGVIDIERLEKVADIDLGGPAHETVVRRGEKVFHSASNTLQHQFSCRSCHPESHMDRLQYDFEPDGLGLNVVDNKSLLGLKGTAPFKWNGRNTSLYMQCGIRFSRFLMRVAPFSIDDLNALVAYLQSLKPPPNGHLAPGGALTATQARGKEIFERAARRDGTPIPENNRCVTCHPGPRYTDLSLRDVGSAGPADTERAFDTPGLENLTSSAPYLHDGRALTLEEIWTLYSPDDTHGVTSDLGKEGLNDLVEYLKTL